MNYDSKILHFLRNFPAWIVLVVMMLIFVGLYKVTGDVAFKEWGSLALASLFTALGVKTQQSPQPPSQNVENAETVIQQPAADVGTPNSDQTERGENT